MLELKVWSDYACFTRPENKVERVSYDVMTPSAARGVLVGAVVQACCTPRDAQSGGGPAAEVEVPFPPSG